MIGSSASAVRFLAGIGMSFFRDSSPGKAAAPAASADGLALVTVTLLDSTFEWKEETEKDKYKQKKPCANKSKLEISRVQIQGENISQTAYYENRRLYTFFSVFAAHCSFERAIDLPGSALPEFSQLHDCGDSSIFFVKIDCFTSVVGITHYKFR